MAKIVNRRRQPFTLLNFFIFIGSEEEKSFVPHPTSCELICTHNNRKEEANDIITSHILCLESETYYSARHGAVWCAGRDNNKRKKRKKKNLTIRRRDDELMIDSFPFPVEKIYTISN